MLLRTAVALCTALLSVSPAEAQNLQGSYRVSLLGIPVGTMTVDQAWSGESYNGKSAFSTTGVVAVVKDVGFIMQSRGARAGLLRDPAHYSERMNTGQRQSNGTVAFPAGDPRWDPNSVLLQVLSPRPIEQGCALNETLYDGTRTHTVTINETGRSAGTLTCGGKMTRTEGYTPEELAKLRDHNFTLSYRAEGDSYVFAGATVFTVYGKASLTPR